MTSPGRACTRKVLRSRTTAPGERYRMASSATGRAASVAISAAPELYSAVVCRADQTDSPERVVEWLDAIQ